MLHRTPCGNLLKGLPFLLHADPKFYFIPNRNPIQSKFGNFRFHVSCILHRISIYPYNADSPFFVKFQYWRMIVCCNEP